MAYHLFCIIYILAYFKIEGKMVKLEFELEENDIEDGFILYKVMRKGLQVGTLALDEEPYGGKKVRISKMRGE